MSSTSFQSLLRSRMNTIGTEAYAQVADLLALAGTCANYDYGTTTGTGVSLDVTVDFNPDFVIVLNETTVRMLVHFRGMTAAHAFKFAGTPAVTAETANCITLDTEKFTIGTDDTNTLGNTLYWFAIGK